MSSNPAERLAAAVIERREELDMTQMDAWNAGGPSNTTLTQIENGRLESLTSATARKLDKALRWKQGSAKAVWAGGAATPEKDMAPAIPPAGHASQRPDDTLLYRRPDGLSDAEWERLKAETRDYLDYLIDKAARER